MNLTGIESLGYSRFDWELAKRKEKDPDVKFEDILKEEMEQLDRRPVMYKSPIEKIFGEMQSQMIKQDEMNMMLSVNQAVGLEREPCGDTISKASVFEILGNLMSIPYDFDRPITEKDVSESMDEIRALPPVTPTRKVGKWINHCFSFVNDDEQIVTECHCNKCYGIAYFRTMGGELVGANICPNCGAEMESEE